MEVEVRLFATLREAVGARTIRHEVAEAATVGDLLRELEAEHADLEGELLDSDGSIRSSITVLHNGAPVSRPDGTGIPLRAGDRVALSLPVTGGTAVRAAR